MNITPCTLISIENLLFGSDNLTDENNLIVFRNVQKIYIILIDLNDMKLYSVLRMLSFICAQFPPPPPFSHYFYLSNILMYTFIIYVTYCHFILCV
jgi:hypothetical protein